MDHFGETAVLSVTGKGANVLDSVLKCRPTNECVARCSIFTKIHSFK